MMTIFELSSSSQKKWDAYVCGSSDATFMHLAGWQHILKQQYNHKTHFLYAQENDKVVGVLPLIHIKSLLAGHYITSLPGGVSARDEATAYALLKHAQQMTQAQKAQYLIIRDSSHHWQLDGMVSTAEHCTAVLPLATDPDEVWQGIKASKRRQAKRATKLGLHVQ